MSRSVSSGTGSVIDPTQAAQIFCVRVRSLKCMVRDEKHFSLIEKRADAFIVMRRRRGLRLSKLMK